MKNYRMTRLCLYKQTKIQRIKIKTNIQSV